MNVLVILVKRKNIEFNNEDIPSAPARLSN